MNSFRNFLILLIIFSNINSIINQNNKEKNIKKQKIKNQKLSEKQKRKIINEIFFSKIKTNKNINKNKHHKNDNNKLTDKNNIMKNINIEIPNNFNNYQAIKYNNEKLLFDEKENNVIDYYDVYSFEESYNIHPFISETYIINEDYKKNDLLIRFNNNKYNQEEQVQRHLTRNINNNKLFKKDNFIQNNENKISYEYEKTNRNINIPPNDDEFDYEMRHYRNGKNFHHQDYNTIRHGPYGSQGSSYISQPNVYSSYPNKGPKSKFSEYMNHIYQLMMVFFFLSLIYKLIFGNKQNDKYALAWYEANKDYFKERYEIFGLVEDEESGTFIKPEDMKDCILIKENPNNYKLICGNYRYIKYIVVNLQFHKRYDMSLLIASFFVPLKDKIVFQVTFNSVDPCGWVFCLGRKNQSSLIKENYEDLNYFCEIYQPDFMNEYMCLISEDLDVFVEMFNNNKNLMQYYKSVEPFIETIYYSDLINLITEENNIYFSFDIDLSTTYQNRILLEITHFVNLFVDSLAQIKFTKAFKEKVDNNRMLYKESKINDSRKKEMEEKEKHDFIEKWKIKKKMKGKKGLERKKLEKQLKKYQ